MEQDNRKFITCIQSVLLVIKHPQELVDCFSFWIQTHFVSFVQFYAFIKETNTEQWSDSYLVVATEPVARINVMLWGFPKRT